MLADAERSDAPADDGEGVAADLPVAQPGSTRPRRQRLRTGESGDEPIAL
jgi:hypothetical protein